MKVNIVTTEQQYSRIRRKLFPPGDANEHFGFGIAGISRHVGGCNLLLRDFVPADTSCLSKQSGASVRPDPRFIDYVWTLVKRSKSGLIDFHTHPFANENVTFSGIDDRSEYDSFPKAVGFLGKGPHASIVLGRNSLDARWYNPETCALGPVAAFKVLGGRLTIITPTSATRLHGVVEQTSRA